MVKKNSQIIKLNQKRNHSILREHTKVLNSGHVYLEPGGECGLHSTKHYEEILIILEGEGIIIFENDTQVVKENNVVYIPPYTSHNIIAGNKPLKYIYIVVPVYNESESVKNYEEVSSSNVSS